MQVARLQAHDDGAQLELAGAPGESVRGSGGTRRDLSVALRAGSHRAAVEHNPARRHHADVARVRQDGEPVQVPHTQGGAVWGADARTSPNRSGDDGVERRLWSASSTRMDDQLGDDEPGDPRAREDGARGARVLGDAQRNGDGRQLPRSQADRGRLPQVARALAREGDLRAACDDAARY